MHLGGGCTMKPRISLLANLFVVICIFFVSSLHEAAALEYTIQKYSSGTYLGLDAADMDGDGKAEILAGSWQGNHVEIWKFDQMTNALVKIDDITGFPGNTISIKAADFDKDGDIDVVVGLRFAGLWYATNNGPGNWSLKQIDPTYSWKVLVGDLDNDGNLDIYDGANQAPYIRLFYGDGNGNFTNPGRNFPSTVLPRGFNIADINNDGILDLIGTGALYMRAFLNPGGRTTDWLSIGPTVPFAVSGVSELVTNLSPSAADLDGNGVLDQVAYLHNYATNTREVIVFEGIVSNGVYSWTKRIIDTISAVSASGTAGIADLNDDGYPDIIIGGRGSGAVYGVKAYLGDGAGNYTPEPIIDKILGAILDHGIGEQQTLVTLDINGDGTTDIVTNRIVNGQDDGFELLLRMPVQINVAIDIKPGSDPNSINLSSAGVIPVAILSSTSFDATTVNPDTITLAGASVKVTGKSGKYLCHTEDVNNDALPDLVCQVYTAEFMIETGETVAVLLAKTFDNKSIRGEDNVRIVPDQ